MKNDNRIYWIDVHGKKWDVDKMSPAHIKNAFKFLLRRINEHRVEDDMIMDYILNGAHVTECDATEIDIY